MMDLKGSRIKITTDELYDLMKQVKIDIKSDRNKSVKHILRSSTKIVEPPMHTMIDDPDPVGEMNSKLLENLQNTSIISSRSLKNDNILDITPLMIGHTNDIH